MSAVAVLFLVIAAVVVWGGLVSSILFLAAKPSVSTYPEGGVDADE